MIVKAFNYRKAIDVNWTKIESQQRRLIDFLKGKEKVCRLWSTLRQFWISCDFIRVVGAENWWKLYAGVKVAQIDWGFDLFWL